MTALRNSRHSREGGNPQGMEGKSGSTFAKRKGDTSERSEIAGHARAAAANQSNFLLAALHQQRENIPRYARNDRWNGITETHELHIADDHQSGVFA